MNKRYISRLNLILAILLLLLFILPLLPGEIWLDSPGSSGSLQIAGGSLSCTGDSGQPKTTNTYSSKKGFPIAYSYNYRSTLTQICNGTPQSSSGNTVSGFNELAIVIDVALALLLAFGVTRLIYVMKR